jgi:hypothetical protein
MLRDQARDPAAPVAEFSAAGYELAHHGEGQLNGVAVASRSIRVLAEEPMRVSALPSGAGCH